MSTITFSNGKTVNFNGTPTQADIEEVAASLESQVTAEPAPVQTDTYGALFPAQPTDTPLTAGLKATGNIPSSAFNLAKGVVESVAHPVDTLKGIGSAAVGGVEKLIPGQQGQEPAFDVLVSSLRDRYGSLENLQRTATNDPFGFGTDVLALLSGGAALAGKSAQVASTIEKVGSAATKPIAKTAAKTAEKAGGVAKFGTSQATALSPDTISTLIKNPEAISAAQKAGTDRATLGSNLKTAVAARKQALSDLGEAYDPIRAAQVPVTLPEDWFASILKKHNIDSTSGKLSTTKESTVLNNADIQALQHFHDLYARETAFTPNSYLNAREALTQLSKYDAAKTGNLASIARDARAELNRFRNQIPGLKELDELYAPEVTELRAIEKEWINPKTGELKDSALSQIANAANQTKGGTDLAMNQKLARLETAVPGITKQIQVVKALEDIAAAYGNKVGSYVRGGTVVGGLMTGNIPLIVGAIMSQPEIAVPLLKGYGYTAKTVAPVLKALQGAASDINNFRVPGAVQNYLKEKQPGMSIKAVDNTIPKELQPLAQEALKYKSAEDFVKAQTSIPNELSYLSKQAEGVSYGTFKRRLTSNIGSVEKGEIIPDDVAEAVFTRLQKTAQRGEFGDEATLFKDSKGRNPQRLVGDEKITVYRATPVNNIRAGDFVSLDKSEAGFYTSATKKIYPFKVKKSDLVSVEGSMGGGQELIYIPKGSKQGLAKEYFSSPKNFWEAVNGKTKSQLTDLYNKVHGITDKAAQ